MSEFNRVLRFSLDLRRMSFSDLVEKSGFVPAYVMGLINDAAYPDYNDAMSLASVLNRDPKLFVTAMEDDMKKALGRDVSISEILRMRQEENLTNEEIAQRLDCSVSTISRYIGTRREKTEVPAEQPVARIVKKADDSHPSLDEVISYAIAHGYSPDRAQDYYNHCVERNWISVRGGVINRWKQSMAAYITRPSDKRIYKNDEHAANESVEAFDTPNTVVVDDAKVSPMKALNVRMVASLQGVACVYNVDTLLPYVELTDANGGQVNGLINYDSIPAIIDELRYLYENRGKVV